MTSVTFRDESPGGRATESFTVPGLPGELTVRELIRIRVREEVALHNAKPARRFHGLVQPDGAEADRDGYLLKEARKIDWESQAAVAERAFVANGFVMLVGDVQVEELDELVDLNGDPELVFIRLVPLAGG
ncbi:hypothetical protein J4573_42405 [Actinomadura barringtoniae]|uniref:Uncharacterized protein n=1 Tax=Actinomadura barringtoniae TaxID=1427535 RepID=A0A939T860_9ACTN|nr:hypothetical protein [Actinomadura barringtoniae]MBO2453803.1 hypothetical protein [Actinomadura barringtoniae]